MTRQRLSGVDLERFHAGDERVFRAAVTECTPYLLAAALRFARDRDDAHDLVQDTWLRAFDRRHSYSGSGTLVGWLLAICRSICLNAARRHGAETRRSAHGTVGDPPPDPYDQAAASEAARDLHARVMELPERERDVVLLRFVQQRSTRETADALGIAEGTVKATLSHALAKLKPPMKAWAT